MASNLHQKMASQKLSSLTSPTKPCVTVMIAWTHEEHRLKTTDVSSRWQVAGNPEIPRQIHFKFSWEVSELRWKDDKRSRKQLPVPQTPRQQKVNLGSPRLVSNLGTMDDGALCEPHILVFHLGGEREVWTIQTHNQEGGGLGNAYPHVYIICMEYVYVYVHIHLFVACTIDVYIYI